MDELADELRAIVRRRAWTAHEREEEAAPVKCAAEPDDGEAAEEVTPPAP